MRFVEHLVVGVILLVGVACTTPRPATLKEQRTTLETAEPQTASDWARLGWWRLMDGQPRAAASAFTQGNELPLAALGRAVLARDRMDYATVFEESVRASKDAGLVGQIAIEWAGDARRLLPPDASRAAVKFTGGESIASDAHTNRISYLVHLDLRRLHREGVSIEGDEVRALGRKWPLRKSRPDGSEGLSLSRFPIDEQTARLRVDGSGHFIIWRGTRMLAASNLSQPSPGVVEVEANGSGPIWVAWSGSKPPALERVDASLVSPLVTTPTTPDRRPGINWLARYLAAEQALILGKNEAAHTALDGAPDAPLFQQLRARALLGEFGTPAGIRRHRAIEALGSITDSTPARVHYQRGRLSRLMGRVDDAEGHLHKAMARAPRAFPIHREQLRLLLAGGRRMEASRALAQANRFSPGACALLDERLRLVGGKPEVQTLLLSDLLRCNRGSDTARWLLDRRRPEKALEILAGVGADDGVQRLRIEALLALDRMDEAREALESLDDFASSVRAHDLSEGGDPALFDLLRSDPDGDGAVEIFALKPASFPAAKDRFDTDAVIEKFETSNLTGGPATRVLDHNLVWLTDDGRMVRWIHEIIAIGSREAARYYGEANLPDGARPIMLFTRKADGRRLYTREQAEKESLSFPDLEVGDYLVAQYLQVTDNGYLYRRGFMTPRVWFQGVDMPIFVQRFSVYAPGQDPLQVEGFNGAPEALAVERSGGQGLRFERHGVARRSAEQRSPAPSLWLPSIRVGRGVSLDEDLKWFRDQISQKRVRTRRFDRWVRSAIQGASDPVLAMARQVRSTIDAQAGLVADGVVRSMETGHGNRGLVFSAALESMGIDHTLVLARPRIQPKHQRFTQVADFSYPLIRLADGRWIDPGPTRAPIGFIPFPYLGGDAVVLWPPQSGEQVQVPSTRTVGDGRTIAVRARWAADGQITGEVVDTIFGQEGIVVGNAMASRTPPERDELVQYLFAGVVPAARISDLNESSARDPDGPLVMRYRFTAKMKERLGLGLFPVRPGRNFAALQKRTTPLEVELPVNQKLSLRIESEIPFDLKGAGGEWRVEGAHYRSRVEHEGGRLEVESTLHIDGGLLAPENYPDFSRWARKVSAAEQMLLTRKPQSSARVSSAEPSTR